MAKESLPQSGAAVYCLPPALQNEIACSAGPQTQCWQVLITDGRIASCRESENLVQQGRMSSFTQQENRSQPLTGAHDRHNRRQEGML